MGVKKLMSRRKNEFPCVFVPHVSDVFAGVGVGGLLVTQDVGVVVVLPVRGAVAGAAVQARALVVHRHVSDIPQYISSSDHVMSWKTEVREDFTVMENETRTPA